MDKKEEKVLVIGNGFDLYHYLPTRYIDFIRTVNRLIELENRSNLENCRYIRYLWGPDSPLYQQDVFIQKCYKNHTDKMRSVELKKEKLQELVDIAKKNTWIKYFQACLDKNVGWIDFEKEIGNVLLAVQELLSLDNRVQDLILGILISTNSSIDLKTFDILEHMPFVEETENTLVLKKEYCKKSIGNEYYVSINKEMILEQLEDDLEKLARALCIYLKEFVQKIAIDKAADNTVFYGVDKIINFNYTDTYRRLYGAKVDVKFIHGSIDNEENGIVLGINNDSKDELEEMDSSLIKFKKYYQRAIKDTFYSVEDFLNDENVEYKVSIVGHSIDITDRDILVGLMNHPRTKITIYYHDEKTHGQQVVNLISLVGKNRFDELRNQKKVMFSKLKEFKEASYELLTEECEDYENCEEPFEYKIRHQYRILEEQYSESNTLLIGSEMVHVSVRDEQIGVTEIKLVDCFLELQEYFNHSGLYKGVVKLVSLFHDNRYGSAGAYIEYIKSLDESDELISKIIALFDTECDGIFISVVDVKVVEGFM